MICLVDRTLFYQGVYNDLQNCKLSTTLDNFNINYKR